MNANTRIVIVGCALALWAAAAAAQVKVGENTNLNLSGNVSTGYSGSYGDTIDSSHGINFGGNGLLSGSYYNPKFLNFNIQPFYNRSQNNSTFQSLTDSSGVNAAANIFTGSRFPGAVAYSRSFDSSGQFAIPGINGFTTHGNGQTFGITWSALLPKFPTLTLHFTNETNDFEVFGANNNNKNTTRNFDVQSTYQLDGFRINGGYYRQAQSGMFPANLNGEPQQNSDNTTNQYVLQTSHALPLQGSWFFGWTHSNFDGTYENGYGQSGSNSGVLNVLNTGVVVNPFRKLSLSMVTTYNSNVFGALQQQILQAGGAPSEILSHSSGKSLTFNGTAYYKLTNHIGLNGNVIHLDEFFPDNSYGVTQYGGGVNVNYVFKLLGNLNFSINGVDTATQRGNEGASIVGNVNFGRRIGHWETGGNFSYTQQAVTLLSNYLTSTYNFSGNMRRRFMNGLQWTGVVTGSRSGFMRVAGDNNHAYSFSSNITYGHFAVNGTYSRSGGISFLTSQGLVTVPNLPPELLREQMLYNAESWAVGGGATMRRFSLTFNYGKAYSQTLGAQLGSWFDTTLMNARLQWRLRKLNVNGGYTNLNQGYVTTTSSRPSDINTFYIGVSRWFNVF